MYLSLWLYEVNGDFSLFGDCGVVVQSAALLRQMAHIVATTVPIILWRPHCADHFVAPHSGEGVLIVVYDQH